MIEDTRLYHPNGQRTLNKSTEDEVVMAGFVQYMGTAAKSMLGSTVECQTLSAICWGIVDLAKPKDRCQQAYLPIVTTCWISFMMQLIDPDRIALKTDRLGSSKRVSN